VGSADVSSGSLERLKYLYGYVSPSGYEDLIMCCAACISKVPRHGEHVDTFWWTTHFGNR